MTDHATPGASPSTRPVPLTVDGPAVSRAAARDLRGLGRRTAPGGTSPVRLPLRPDLT